MAIHILPSELANQIAAGEVVERPASIIKELVENSIDAGASQINIDIEQGGCKLIRIRDNGCGIAKDELALALTRHATSKITTLDDLEAITSLGFRGEALASISSVSRLTLTSKTESQTEAWLVYAEGRDMLPIIKPAAHPTGTSVEVLDIFYNTPARRRFLKTEKTEFSHIDEVIRRIALACPYVSFTLQHNGKLIKQYRAAHTETETEKRIIAICGSAFMQKAIKLSWQHDDLLITGWIAPNTAQDPLQYFYVNGRIVKDRLINHALKQAFQTTHTSAVATTDQTLSYIIYLTLDPHQVDVNVHPAKHEVRFHEARLVHDFVYQAVIMALNKQKQQTNGDIELSDLHTKTVALPDNRVAAGQSIFQQKINEDNLTTKVTLPLSHTVNNSAKKVNHINENKLYGHLIASAIDKRNLNETVISPEQQAVIESLFPKRNEPLAQVTTQVNVSNAAKLGRVLTILANEYVLLEKSDQEGQKISLLSLKKAQLILFKATLLADDSQLKIEPLLIPLSILLSKLEQQIMHQSQNVLKKLNFDFYLDKAKLQLTGVPKLMRKANWQQLLPDLITLLSHSTGEILEQQVSDWLTKQYIQSNEQQVVTWSLPKAIQLLSELEQVDDHLYEISDIIKPVDFSTTFALF